MEGRLVEGVLVEGGLVEGRLVEGVLVANSEVQSGVQHFAKCCLATHL